MYLYLERNDYKMTMLTLQHGNKQERVVLTIQDTTAPQVTFVEKLEQVGIHCQVKARLKSVYSIYRKLYGQNLRFSELYDICATRVIVKSLADCYNVLGCIHDMFKPVPGRFKDYISSPKPNMYQSVHTTVIGSEGIPFEVQIRTWDMHTVAEYGLAAHWKYKTGEQAKKDIKRTKGYNDAEISEMDLPALKKECQKFRIKSIILAVCSVMLVFSSLPNMDEAAGYFVFGIIAGVIAFRFNKQYKKFKARIDENNK